MNDPIKNIKGLIKDKNGDWSLRELATGLFLLMMLLSWGIDTFTRFEVQEYMFYAFSSLVGAGIFGYSLEKKSGAALTNN